jgi:hypothetical protein
VLAEERTDEVGRIQLRDQVKKLTLPTEMGSASRRSACSAASTSSPPSSWVT